ncbi:DMT family transporter [Ensifer aridi]|uniref:DMT family transporter n=1 Tax=Ensifer aridi TaxID=1708715 RepID=UPI000A0F8FA2|nr:DMT family transporter [Ensifer aridi]
MQKRTIDWTVLLALIAGVVLAVMTDWNSQLARYSSPLFASWTAHGIGAIASMALVLILSARGKTMAASVPHQRWPLWSYLGGVPGAFTVLLAAITVNSALGLAGTLALLLVGQMAFGVLADYFGLFRLQRRQPRLHETIGFALVLIGSIVVIVARS